MSPRELLGRHPDPLLVELLVGAVVPLISARALLTGSTSGLPLGERNPVLLARRDGFDEPDLPVALHDLPVHGREVVDHPLDLPCSSAVRPPLWFCKARSPLSARRRGAPWPRSRPVESAWTPTGASARSPTDWTSSDAPTRSALVGVEVGIREVPLLLALFGYGHRRDGRVEEVGVGPTAGCCRTGPSRTRPKPNSSRVVREVYPTPPGLSWGELGGG